jgi:YtkA-like
MSKIRLCCALALVLGACSTTSDRDDPSALAASAGESGRGSAASGAGGEAGEAHVEAGGASGAAGAAGATADDIGTCADEVRARPYAEGLVAEGEGGMLLTLERSSPTPRVGSHRWALHISDAAGEPVVGAKVRVAPFMPDHGHGSPLVAVVDELGDGAYEAFPVQFNMTGYWRVTVKVTTETRVDSAVFQLCIE